jgi:hypothetical protein
LLGGIFPSAGPFLAPLLRSVRRPRPAGVESLLRCVRCSGKLMITSSIAPWVRRGKDSCSNDQRLSPAPAHNKIYHKPSRRNLGQRSVDLRLPTLIAIVIRAWILSPRVLPVVRSLPTKVFVAEHPRMTLMITVAVTPIAGPVGKQCPRTV